MRVAILCRKPARMALKTATHFRAGGLEVSLLVVEAGVRRKFSEAERQFQAAHDAFQRYLLRSSTLMGKVRLLPRVVWSRLPPACRNAVRPSVMRRAKALEIPTFVVPRHSSSATREILEENDISYALLTSSAWLIKEPLLSMKTRIINAHCAKLPEHRSLDALPWSVLENDRVGLTAHFVDQGVDTGPVLLFEEVAPQKGDNLIRLRQRVDGKKPEVFFKVVRGLAGGTVTPIPQRPSEGTHHPPMTFDELVRAETALQRRLALEPS